MGLSKNHIPKVYILYYGAYYEAVQVGTGFDPNGYSAFNYIKYKTRVGTLNIHKFMKTHIKFFDTRLDAVCYMGANKPDEGKYERAPYSQKKMNAICRKYQPELLI